MSLGSNPAGVSVLLNSINGAAISQDHVGGWAAISSSLTGSLTLTTASNAVQVIAPGSVGAVAINPANGAQSTAWQFSNAADVGKVALALFTPNTYR